MTLHYSSTTEEKNEKNCAFGEYLQRHASYMVNWGVTFREIPSVNHFQVDKNLLSYLAYYHNILYKISIKMSGT